MRCHFAMCPETATEIVEVRFGPDYGLGDGPHEVRLCRVHLDYIRQGVVDRLSMPDTTTYVVRDSRLENVGQDRDPWLEREMAAARSSQIQHVDEVILRGVQARRELLRALELTDLSDGPFRTHDGQQFNHSGGYALDQEGRLHKEVAGRWIRQCDPDGSGPLFVVRTP